MPTISLFCAVSILGLAYVLAEFRGAPSTRIMLALTVAILSLGSAAFQSRIRQASTLLPGSLLSILAIFAAYSTSNFSQQPWSHRYDLLLWLLGIALTLLQFRYQDWSPGLSISRRIIFPIALLGFSLAGINTIRQTPAPPIDVFLFQQAAAQALANGMNPYEAIIPDIYGPGNPGYNPMVENGYTTYGTPYAPIVAIVSLPVYQITGDIRYMHMFELLASACLLVLMQESWVSLGAALLLLFNPFSLPLLESAWMEPLTILTFCAAVFTASRWPRATPYLFGLFLATKQTNFALLPFCVFLLEKNWTWKSLATIYVKALAVAIATYLPFIYWNPHAFIQSMIYVQLNHPLRLDLVSYIAYAVRRGLPAPPMWIPFLTLPIGLYPACAMRHALRKASPMPPRSC